LPIMPYRCVKLSNLRRRLSVPNSNKFKAKILPDHPFMMV
jgi:hypothetical protein